MLAPDSRTLLLDALRPPAGTRLEHAIATTFTLDLHTAITVPLALAGYTFRDTPDAVAVMDALRSTSENIDIFYQDGMMAAREWPGALAGLMEKSVHGVKRPKNGFIFHPKVWVMRFRRADDEQALYRCLVTSRNLTYDRTWDFVLVLDSNPEITRVNDGDNFGLIRLLRRLSDADASRAGEERRAKVARMAEELRRVWWQMPAGVESLTFHALGVKGTQRPKLADMCTGYRHLIVSPFLSRDGVTSMLGNNKKTYPTIVSRAEELAKLPWKELPAADLFTVSSTADMQEAEAGAGAETEHLLRGLHAKIYVIESNRRARVLLGSANATSAALGGNTEILVEMTGAVKDLGVEAMVGKDARFRQILESYTPPDTPVADEESEIGRRLEGLLIDIAEKGFTLALEADGSQWRGVLCSDEALPSRPEGVSDRLVIAPYSHRQAEQYDVAYGQVARVSLPPRPSHEFTAFFVVTAMASGVSKSAVVCARVVGEPEERTHDILASLLDTPEKFLRFLLLLLRFGGGEVLQIEALQAGAGTSWREGDAVDGLFERFVHALAVQPGIFDGIDALVKRISEIHPQGSILPEGWTTAWKALQGAREKLGTGEMA